MLGCSRDAGSGWRNTGIREVRRVFFLGLGWHGDVPSHGFTETLCFSKPSLQDVLRIEIVLLEDVVSCFWYKELRSDFVIFQFCSPSADL